MTTIELNNRKYTLIEEIMRIDSDAVIEKIEKLIDNKKQYRKSPLSYLLKKINVFKLLPFGIVEKAHHYCNEL